MLIVNKTTGIYVLVLGKDRRGWTLVLIYFCVFLGTDDEPDDGPQHYILVLGFYQPHLIGVLDAIGVHIANVIKLCSERRQTYEVQQEQHTSKGSEQSQRKSPVLDGGKLLNICASLSLHV